MHQSNVLSCIRSLKKRFYEDRNAVVFCESTFTEAPLSLALDQFRKDPQPACDIADIDTIEDISSAYKKFTNPVFKRCFINHTGERKYIFFTSLENNL